VLFDLRSPRRRAAVKVIYGTLAVLMGAGLVLFGIGGEVAGGLVDGLGLGGGSSTTFDDQIEDAEKQVEENPRDQAALLELVTLNIQAGNQQLSVDEETLQTSLTSDSEQSYNDAADAWDQYLKLNPKNPDASAALQLANAFVVIAQSSTSFADAQIALKNAAEAQAVAAEQNPIVGNLKNLAVYEYYAGDVAAGDRAAAQAVAKSPPNQREATRKQLEAAKKQAARFQKQAKAQAESGATGGGEANPLDQTGGTTGGLGGGSLAAP
jgi:hypothetical protein